jgi:hypothetical protein
MEHVHYSVVIECFVMHCIVINFETAGYYLGFLPDVQAYCDNEQACAKHG